MEEVGSYYSVHTKWLRWRGQLWRSEAGALTMVRAVGRGGIGIGIVCLARTGNVGTAEGEGNLGNAKAWAQNKDGT